MSLTDLPPPPLINEDIYINQFTNECEKNEITEGNKEEYSKEITNENEYFKLKEDKITENPQDEQLNNIDKDKIREKTIKINNINNIEKEDNEIIIINDIIIQEKKVNAIVIVIVVENVIVIVINVMIVVIIVIVNVN